MCLDHGCRLGTAMTIQFGLKNEEGNNYLCERKKHEILEIKIMKIVTLHNNNRYEIYKVS